MFRFITLLLLTLAAAGCSEPAEQDVGKSSTNASALEGRVRVDGSSTVFPVSEAVAEEFGTAAPRVRVTVGVSGTGGGFKKFINGETDINDASRSIKPSEMQQAAAAGISFIELPVAFDGLSVVVNPQNDWVDYLTVDELHRIWRPGSQVMTWQDVRGHWPNQPIKLYGPGTDSGTFDYFTEAVNGESQSSRADFSASEDDNVLVQGVAGDRYALGYFGYAYYEENQDKLKVVPIDGGSGPIAPNPVTINDGSYAPLSRPIFLYVRTDALDKPQVEQFVHFYLDNAGILAREVGYIELPEETYQKAKVRVDTRETGTAYGEDATVSTLLTSH